MCEEEVERLPLIVGVWHYCGSSLFGTRAYHRNRWPAIPYIDAWPIRGIVVISGKGFSPNMRYYLISSGKAVEAEDLEDWLRLYFGLPLDTYQQARLLVAEPASPEYRAG